MSAEANSISDESLEQSDNFSHEKKKKIESADDIKSKKSKKVSPDYTTFISDASEQFHEFMSKKLEQGEKLKSPEEAFKKYEREFYDDLRNKNKGHLIEAFQKHLKKQVSFKDIGKAKIDGGMIFDDYRREKLYASMHKESAETYYATLVKKQMQGFADYGGIGMERKWKTHLQDAGLPREMKDLPTEKELASGKKLPKGKEIFDKDTFRKYVQTFQEFLRRKDVDITPEQQEKIVQSGTISNTDFIEAVSKNKGYEKKYDMIYLNGLSYNKKTKVAGKKDIEKGMAKFWDFQETVLHYNVKKVIENDFGRLSREVRDTEAMMKGYGLTGGLFSKCPVATFLKYKEKQSVGVSNQEKISELHEITDAFLTGQRRGETLTPGHKKDLEVRLGELKKELYVGGVADVTDEHATFVEEYLDWMDTAAGEDIQTKQLVKLFRKHRKNLGGLSGTTTKEGRNGENKQDSVALMRHLAGLFAKKHAGRENIFSDIAKTYNFDGHKEQYENFLMDIYDPSKMEVALPPINGFSTKIRFAKKSLQVDSETLEDMLFKDKDMTDVFDMGIEIIDIGGLSIDEFEMLQGAAFAQLRTPRKKIFTNVPENEQEEKPPYRYTDAHHDFKMFEPTGDRKNKVVLKNNTEYTVHTTKNDTPKHLGKYVFAQISLNPDAVGHDTPVQTRSVLLPKHLADARKDDKVSDVFLKDRDDVIFIDENNIGDYEFARTQGGDMGTDDLFTLQALYRQNEEFRADFVNTHGVKAKDLDTYTDPQNTDLIKGVKRIFGEHGSDTTQKPGEAGEKNETYWDSYFAHIAFSDTAPDPDTVEYIFKNEGKVVAWLDDGKVHLLSGDLEAQYNFKFERDEKTGEIIHPPKFSPLVDDGKGRRGIRHMFGNYSYNTTSALRERKQGADVWNQDMKNDMGLTFFSYISSLVAHEKAHRIFEYVGLRDISLFDGALVLDQELLSEIAEWFVAPKQTLDLSKEKTTSLKEIATSEALEKKSKNNILDVFDGSSSYRVTAIDHDSGKLQIEKKTTGMKYVLDIDSLEGSIWNALLANSTSEKHEKIKGLRKSYERNSEGKFFKRVRNIDQRLSVSGTNESYEGYADLTRRDGNPFTGVMAATDGEVDSTGETGEAVGGVSVTASGAQAAGEAAPTGAGAIEQKEVQKKHGTIERVSGIQPHMIDKDKFYVYGDNIQHYGVDLQTRGSDMVWPGLDELQGAKRLPVRTMNTYSEYLQDNDLEANKKLINEDIARIRNMLREGIDVVIRHDSTLNRWLVGRHLGERGAPLTHAYIQEELEKLYQESLTGEVKAPSVIPPALLDDPTSDLSGIKTREEKEAAGEANSDDGLESEVLDRDTAFEELKGDDTVGINDEPAIMFRVQDSKLQGFGSVWLKGKMIKASGGYDIVLEDASEGSLSAHGIEGNRFHIATPDDLQKLYRRTREGMYRFKDLKNPQEFYTYITGSGSENDKSGILGKGNLKWTPQYMNRNGSKITKKYDHNEQQEEDERSYIGKAMDRGQHFGHPEDSVLEFYRIQQHSDGVTVEAVTGEYRFKQKMSRTTFMIFMTEKQMHPYTEKEYTAQKEETHKQYKGNSSSFWDYFLSINSVIAALKKFPEAFKYRMEQNEKFEAGKLYEQLATTLLPSTNLFNLNDIKADAESELDTSIMQVIEGYKDRLSRKDGDNKGVHGNRSCERIEKEIFLNVRNTQSYKHRAAGYLAWLTENEGNIYPRGLAKYAGEGMWVRVLLGKEQQEEFLKWRAWKHDEVKNQGTEDEENLHDYVFMELLFLQERCDDSDYVKKLYGSRFPKKIEMAIEVMGSEGRLNKVREGVDNKGSVYAVVNEANSKLEKLQPTKAYACIDNLAQRCEEPHHYHAFYKILMKTMIGGVGNYTMSNTLKGKIKQIGRTFGVPFCLMIKDIHHPWKTTRIIDNIALNNKIPTMTDFIQKRVPGWDARDQTESNYTQGNRHIDVMKGVGERWTKYGYLAMDSLNNMNANMLKVSAKHDPKSTSETKQALSYYNGKLFDGERDTKTAVSDDAYKAVLNPMFGEGVLNFQKPAFNKLFQSGNSREGQMDSNTREMWKHLKRKVDVYGQDLSGMKYASDTETKEVYKQKFAILFKKFCEYFKEDFIDEEQAKIRQYFKEGRILEGKESVLGRISDLKFMNSLKDGVSQKTIKSFLEVFDEHKELFQGSSMLADEFMVTIT